ncbi:MAG: hypothetical protein QXU88_00115 [Candidatus Woesearchaeota archaeon]
MQQKAEFKCESCRKSFGSSEALAMHSKAKHGGSTTIQYSAKPRKGIWKVIAVVFIILTIGFVIWAIFGKGDKSIDGSAQNTDFVLPKGPIHWHPHLTIKINGKEQIIPANIGITPRLHYPVHTHSADGIIHLEMDRPSLELLRLSYFFKVWGKRFDKECIFEYCADKGSLKMFVNGKESQEFEKHIMRDGEEILIEYNSFE